MRGELRDDALRLRAEAPRLAEASPFVGLGGEWVIEMRVRVIEMRGRGGIEGEVGVIEGECSDVIEGERSDVIEVRKRLEGRVRESTKTEYTRRSREVYGR